MSIKRSAKLFFVGLASIATMTTQFASSVSATSVYDDVVELSNQLVVTGGGQSEDVTNSFKTYLNNTSAYTSPGICSGWSQMYDEEFNAGLNIKYLSSIQSSSVSVHIGWIDNTPGSEAFSFATEGPGRVLKSDSVTNYKQITLNKDSSGATKISCTHWYTGSPSGDSAVIYAGGYYSPGVNLWAIYGTNFPVNYPSGYAGDTVPSNVAIPISGNIQCGWGDTAIDSVYIDTTSGVDGGAVTSDAYGGKDYGYFLSESSSYTVRILCDGEYAFTPTVSGTGPYNFVCVHDDDLGYYCVLS